MNNLSSSLFPGARLALFFALALTLLAQEPRPAEKSTPPADPAAPAAPSSTTTPSDPAAPAAVIPPPATLPADPAAVATPPTDQTPPVEATTPKAEKKGGLRRIDVPGGEAPAPAKRRPNRNRGNGHSEFPFGDHYVPKNGDLQEAVSVLGSTTVDGKVRSDAVSVLGDTTVGADAKIQGAAVAVLGNLKLDGEVGDEAVAVLGNSTINGKVGGDAVTVLGDLRLGPKAEIGGDITVVGGKLIKDPGAVIHGNEVNVPILGGMGKVDWLVSWLKQCALKGRLLAFGADLSWAWAIAFSFFVFYVLLALLFPRGIEKCAITLETRPGATILSSVLTVLLTPVATIILAVTVIGAILVPFVAAALFFAGLFGKAVMLAWVGRRFTKFFGNGPLGHPVFAVMIGGILVMLLYTVWGSILLYKLISWIGLGVVVLTVAQTMKREKAPPAAPATVGGAPDGTVPVADVPSVAPVVPMASSAPVVPLVVPAAPATPTTPVSPIPPTMSAGFTGGGDGAGNSVSDTGAPGVPTAPPPIAPPPPPPVPPVSTFRPQMPPPISALTFPRVGFFPRLAAMVLDAILVGVLLGFASSMTPRALHFNPPGSMLLVLAIYASVMWKHKGTTIGGIVCGLKVVRIDNREIDWATAIVRSLGCFLSMVVAGLGFIWVAFDDDKQSWHDKIAGTTVVRVPKGVSLL